MSMEYDGSPNTKTRIVNNAMMVFYLVLDGPVCWILKVRNKQTFIYVMLEPNKD